MAKETRIETILDQLNSALGDVTPYKLAIVDPAKIQHVDKNARYMSKKMMDQLTSNVANDGNLASLPFCWMTNEGQYISLSGNHRVDAAVGADIPKILILYTDDGMSKAQARAIQLSHNAIAGQDNPTILRELWNEIDDYQYKVYSGLDEEYLETLEPVSIISIQDQALRFEELSLMFLSPEIDRIEEIVEKLGESGRRRFLNDHKLWDKFWNTLLDFKEAANVVNSSTAIAMMAEIAAEWLEHNAAEQDEQEKQTS